MKRRSVRLEKVGDSYVIRMDKVWLKRKLLMLEAKKRQLENGDHKP